MNILHGACCNTGHQNSMERLNDTVTVLLFLSLIFGFRRVDFYAIAVPGIATTGSIAGGIIGTPVCIHFRGLV